MVGVAGGSKGCITCRRRKIRCDLERPSCRRCAVGKRTCEGYTDHSSFIHVNPRRSHNERLKLEESRSRSAPLPLLSRSPSVPHASGTTAPPIDEISAMDQPMTLFPSIDLAPKGRLSPTLSVAGQLDTNFIGLFFKDFMPKNPLMRGEPRGGYNWLTSIMRLHALGTDPPLKLSLRALCMTRMARLRADEELVRQGHLTYGHALKAVQYALWSEKHMWTNQTIAAAACLEMFELFESTKDSPNGWLSHQSGMEKMIQMRGPDAFRDLMSTGLCGDIQHTAMIRSLMKRKVSFLGTPEWRTKPWQGSRKNVECRLYDYGFAFAHVLEDMEKCFGWSADSQIKHEFLSESLSRLFDIDASLEQFIPVELHEEFDPPLYWPDLDEASQLGIITSEIVEKANYKYQSLRVAALCTMTWALHLLVTSGIVTLTEKLNILDLEGMGRLGTFPPCPQYQRGSEHRTVLLSNILRSMHYMLQPDMGTVGPARCIFPMSIVSTAVKASPIERAAFPEADYFSDLLINKRKIGLASAVRDNAVHLRGRTAVYLDC